MHADLRTNSQAKTVQVPHVSLDVIQAFQPVRLLISPSILEQIFFNPINDLFNSTLNFIDWRIKR